MASIVSLLWSILYYLTIFLSAILSVLYITHKLHDSKTITPYTLIAINFMAGYMIGPSVAAIYYLQQHALPPGILAGPFSFFGQTQQFAAALWYSATAIVILLFVDNSSKSYLIENIRQVTSHGIRTSDWLFVLLLIAIVALAFVNGGIGYMGTQTVNDTSHITVLGGLAGTILPALPPIFAGIALIQHSGRMVRLLSWILCTVSLVFVVVMGRRYLIFSLFSLMIVAAMMSYKFSEFFNLRKLFNINILKFVTPILLVVFVFAGTSFFFALRNASNKIGDQLSLLTRIDVATSIWLYSGGEENHFSAQSRARSGTLPGYLGALITSKGPDLLGACFMYGIITSAPRMILRDKERVLHEYSCTDEHVNALHALPEVDSPATILTQGVADFWIFGGLVYAVLIGWVLALASRAVRFCGTGVYGLVGGCIIIITAVYVEQGLGFYFVNLRNVGFLMFIYFGLSGFLKRNPD
jgi:hypothetical protein